MNICIESVLFFLRIRNIVLRKAAVTPIDTIKSVRNGLEARRMVMRPDLILRNEITVLGTVRSVIRRGIHNKRAKKKENAIGHIVTNKAVIETNRDEIEVNQRGIDRITKINITLQVNVLKITAIP